MTKKNSSVQIPRRWWFLSLTPPLLLLLVNTAEESDQSLEYKALVSRLAYRMTIDLFDVVNMIDIALDERRDGHEALRNL